MKIKILGSADGVSTAERFNESILLVVGRSYYLFDAGAPVASLLQREKINNESLKAIFISHFHIDHCGGLPQLIQNFQLRKRKDELPLFLPSEGVEKYREILSFFFLPQEFLPFNLLLLPIKKGNIFKDDQIKVDAFPTTHFGNFSRNNQFFKERYPFASSYSFLITAENKKILYSGDIGSVDDINEFPFSSLNLLILEMAHFPPEEAFRLLKGKEVDKVLLNHISPSYEKGLTDLAEKYLPGKVIIGKDNLEYEL